MAGLCARESDGPDGGAGPEPGMARSDGVVMEALRLERARFGHVPQIVALLASAVPDCSPQTVWDIPWSWPDYWVVSSGGQVVAAAALRSLDDERCELRGLAVDPRSRGRGLARLLVHRLRDLARERGHDMLCVTRSPEFFRRLGFLPTHPFWLDLEPARWPRDGRIDRVPMIASQRPNLRS